MAAGLSAVRGEEEQKGPEDEALHCWVAVPLEVRTKTPFGEERLGW